MGMFDTFVDGERSGQVKCYKSRLEVYEPGDEVPTLRGEETYLLKLREGYVAIIVDNVFRGLVESVEVFDKYGNVYDENVTGIFGYSYAFEEE